MHAQAAKGMIYMLKTGLTGREQAIVNLSKCAKEMAKGGNFTTGSDVAVSVTGIAGPDGGTPEKPVGTVFIACCLKGETKVREFHFNGNRSKIREQSVVNALILLRDCILENFKK